METGMVKLPPVEIVGTSIDPDPKQIGEEPNTIHVETNIKEAMDNVMVEQDDNDIGPIPEKAMEEVIDDRKGMISTFIFLLQRIKGWQKKWAG